MGQEELPCVRPQTQFGEGKGCKWGPAQKAELALMAAALIRGPGEGL